MPKLSRISWLGIHVECNLWFNPSNKTQHGLKIVLSISQDLVIYCVKLLSSSVSTNLTPSSVTAVYFERLHRQDAVLSHSLSPKSYTPPDAELKRACLWNIASHCLFDCDADAIIGVARHGSVMNLLWIKWILNTVTEGETHRVLTLKELFL